VAFEADVSNRLWRVKDGGRACVGQD